MYTSRNVFVDTYGRERTLQSYLLHSWQGSLIPSSPGASYFFNVLSVLFSSFSQNRCAFFSMLLSSHRRRRHVQLLLLHCIICIRLYFSYVLNGRHEELSRWKYIRKGKKTLKSIMPYETKLVLWKCIRERVAYFRRKLWWKLKLMLKNVISRSNSLTEEVSADDVL